MGKISRIISGGIKNVSLDSSKGIRAVSVRYSDNSHDVVMQPLPKGKIDLSSGLKASDVGEDHIYLYIDPANGSNGLLDIVNIGGDEVGLFPFDFGWNIHPVREVKVNGSNTATEVYYGV